MPFYETVFIARQDLTEKQIKDLTDKFCAFITAGGGKIAKTENWGLRTLAYKIQKSRKGHYILIETDTPPAALLEMERNMRLDEEVLRYMSVRLEALSSGPSAILSKGRDYDDDDSDRNDRFDRGDKKDKKEAA